MLKSTPAAIVAVEHLTAGVPDGAAAASEQVREKRRRGRQITGSGRRVMIQARVSPETAARLEAEKTRRGLNRGRTLDAVLSGS